MLRDPREARWLLSEKRSCRLTKSWHCKAVEPWLRSKVGAENWVLRKQLSISRACTVPMRFHSKKGPGQRFRKRRHATLKLLMEISSPTAFLNSRQQDAVLYTVCRVPQCIDRKARNRICEFAWAVVPFVSSRGGNEAQAPSNPYTTVEKRAC